MNDVLSIEEVAELLDCTPATVAERTIAGDLPGVKFGRSWRYPREALIRALNELALSRRVEHQAPVAVVMKTPTVRPRRALPVLPALR